MPSVLINNAPPAQLHQDRPRQNMAMSRQTRGVNTSVCPTDEDVLPKAKQQPQKQSWDYIWRTGLAGGMAGSAVGLLRQYQGT